MLSFYYAGQGQAESVLNIRRRAISSTCWTNMRCRMCETCIEFLTVHNEQAIWCCQVSRPVTVLYCLLPNKLPHCLDTCFLWDASYMQHWLPRACQGARGYILRLFRCSRVLTSWFRAVVGVGSAGQLVLIHLTMTVLALLGSKVFYYTDLLFIFYDLLPSTFLVL